MSLDLSVDEVLTTTRSVRKRLDLERPVEPDLIIECIDIAQQAPTGSNLQGWQWVVVGDPDKKQAIAELYAANFAAYRKLAQPTFDKTDVRTKQLPAVVSSASYLAENFHRVPYVVIPLIKARLGEGSSADAQAGAWGSILPAVWSFMLALRERGLGSAWTTLHLPSEKETAAILNIPYEHYTQAGLFPVAYTKGTDFKPAARIPASQTTHWDSFDPNRQ